MRPFLSVTHSSSPASSPKPIKARLADYLVLAKVRQALGFARCQMSFYGAAPIAAEVELFFLGLNLRLYSAYGLSESSGIQFLSGTSNYRLRRYGPSVAPACFHALARAPWCPPAEWVPEPGPLNHGVPRCKQFCLGPASPARPQSHGGSLCQCHTSLWLKAA